MHFPCVHYSSEYLVWIWSARLQKTHTSPCIAMYPESKVQLSHSYSIVRGLRTTTMAMKCLGREACRTNAAAWIITGRILHVSTNKCREYGQHTLRDSCGPSGGFGVWSGVRNCLPGVHGIVRVDTTHATGILPADNCCLVVYVPLFCPWAAAVRAV